jgi:ribosomal-protein-alanine N-acetyltransferase
MKEIVNHAISYSFNDLRLHRIMANYMPVNDRSAGLLKNLGFQQEGLAKEYLLINGKWEDHVLTSLLNPES